MLAECFAILALVLALFGILLRTRRVQLAFLVLPLVGVPVSHIVSALLASFFAPDFFVLTIVLDILGLVVSTLFCGALSDRYARHAQVTYLVSVGFFNVILTCVLLLNL